MPAISALTIHDGSAPSTAKTFAVQQGQQGVVPAAWLEKTADVYAGFIRLTTVCNRAQKAKATKVSIKLALPKLAVMGVSASGSTPAPTTTSVGYATVEFSIPDNFTAADRANLHAYIVNAVSQTAIKAQILQLEPVY